MWLLSAGDCRPLMSRADGIAGRICRLISCTVRISRWILRLGPEDPALPGHAVDLLAGQVLRDQRHSPAGAYCSNGGT